MTQDEFNVAATHQALALMLGSVINKIVQYGPGMDVGEAAIKLTESIENFIEAKIGELVIGALEQALDKRDAVAKAAGICVCQGCHQPYYADLLVPDDVWEKIAPKPVDGVKGGGLLCPTCIMERVTKAGLWTAGFVYGEQK